MDPLEQLYEKGRQPRGRAKADAHFQRKSRVQDPSHPEEAKSGLLFVSSPDAVLLGCIRFVDERGFDSLRRWG